MANQKERNQVRETVIENIGGLAFEGFKNLGRVSEGILFHEEVQDVFVVVKVIGKKEGFDFEEALAEFEEKEIARKEREQEKAKKLAEKGE